MRRAIHEDMPGFMAAAIAITLASAGSATARRRSSTVPLCDRPERAVEGDEVQELTVGGSPDAVDAGYQRKGIGARVVAAGRARAHPRMKAGGEHIDGDLVLAVRLRASANDS